MPIHNSRLFSLLSVEIEGTLSLMMISQYAAVSAHYFTRGVSIPFPSFSRYLLGGGNFRTYDVYFIVYGQIHCEFV